MVPDEQRLALLAQRSVAQGGRLRGEALGRDADARVKERPGVEPSGVDDCSQHVAETIKRVG